MIYFINNMYFFKVCMIIYKYRFTEMDYLISVTDPDRSAQRGMIVVFL